jgi:maltokinase
VPLVHYPDEQERLAHALVGEWDETGRGHVFVYDALHDRESTALWLAAFADARRDEDLVFHRVEGHELDLQVHSTLLAGEQSNSSVAFGEDSMMKVFRKVTPGRNPDIEIHEALTRDGSEHVPALYGWLEAPSHGGDEPLQLAMLEQFLRTATDGWGLALASVRDLFAEGDLHADEVGGDFAAESHRLGVATAEVHDSLAAAFDTETLDAAGVSALADAMRDRLHAAVEAVPRLGEHAAALAAAYEALAGVTEPVVVQRIHGDYHLGQTLRTVKGWKIVDFEGEPAKPLAERVRPDSPWRDVAGMLRSLDYASHAVEADVEEDTGQIAYRAAEWADRNRNAFLEGYVEASRRAADGTLSPAQHVLVRAYEVDKAVYETIYETRNRPDWVGIPLAAVERLSQDANGHHPMPHPDRQEASDS